MNFSECCNFARNDERSPERGRKKLRALISFIAIFIIFCSSMSGCAVYLDVFKEEYVEWYSENGLCAFTSTLDKSYAFGYITVNDIRLRALFETTYDAKLLITFPYSDELNISTESNGMSIDTTTGFCTGYVQGTRKGDVFHVSSLTAGFTELGSFDMYSRKVEPTDVDARDFAVYVWKSEGDNITIKASYHYRNSGRWDEYPGTVVLNGEDIRIWFRWCDGNRFEIYGDEDDAEERSVLASGSYTNVALNLSLTFEEDTAFGYAGETVNLTGNGLEYQR